MTVVQIAPAPVNSAGLLSSDDSQRAESGGSEPFASLLDGACEAGEPTVAAPVAAESVPVTLAELLAVAAALQPTVDPAAPVPAPLTAAAAATVPMPASSAPTAVTPELLPASTTAATAIAATATVPSAAAPAAGTPGQPTPTAPTTSSPSQPIPAPTADADGASTTPAGRPAELPMATPAAPAEAPVQPAASQAPSFAPGPTAPPSTAGAAAPAPPPTRAVPLEHAVDTVKLALRAAAEHGVSHARISLSPRELGGVEIHLRHTSEGVVARVVAEHAGAAQLLQHAGAELRRAFEAQGITLLQLDVGASDPQGDRTAGEQRGFHAGPGDHRRTARGDASDGDDAPDGDAGGTDTLLLPNGVLVDVLA